MTSATLTQEEAKAQYTAYVQKLAKDKSQLDTGMDKFMRDASKKAEALDRSKESSELENMDFGGA